MANPTLRQTSHQIENVRIVPEMDMVPFQGGMDIVHEPYQLPLAACSNIQNMRPLRPGLIKRKGQIVLHTTPDGTNKVMSVFMFSKGMQDEIRMYAQMNDGDTLEATANPPTVTTGAFGATVHTSESPSTAYPASWAVLKDKLYFTDGTGHPYVYPGAGTNIDSFIVYRSDAAIPQCPIAGLDYTYNVTDNYGATNAPVGLLDTLANYNAIFIKTDSPANAFNFTMFETNVNSNAAVMQLHYWNGEWLEATTGWSDTTSSGGATLAQNGKMSFTMPAEYRPHYMFSSSGYWYRLSLSSGSLSAVVIIDTITYDSEWTALTNVWDGVPVDALEAYVYIALDANYEFYSATAIDLPVITSSDKIYFNSIHPLTGFYVIVGAVPNAEAATMTVKYSTGILLSGTSFVTVEDLSDSTELGGISLAVDGWVTFSHPDDEQAGPFRSSQYMSYWYEISFSGALSEDMSISISTMPWLDMDPFGRCYALSTFKRRLAYSFENVPGYIVISGAQHPEYLNGSDMFIQDVGDGRSNKVICIKRFYNELLVWQEEKGTPGGCLTLVEGYSVSTFGKRIISTLHGTFSAKSAVVVEDVPTQGKIVMAQGGLSQTDTKISAAYFLCRDGIFMTDGKSVELISGAVQDYFDPKKDECIRRGYEKDHWIDFDSSYKVLRIGLVSGVTATTPNVFLIYDIRTKAWSCDVLGQNLSSHAEVEAATGQFPLLQVGGGADDGTVYLLNQGVTDVGAPIESIVMMEFDGGGHTLHLEEIVLRVTGNCTLTPYTDNTAKPDITILA